MFKVDFFVWRETLWGEPPFCSSFQKQTSKSVSKWLLSVPSTEPGCCTLPASDWCGQAGPQPPLWLLAFVAQVLPMGTFS